MKIRDIYEKFKIPPNLQRHMLRVCGIANFLEKHWKYESVVDFVLTKQVCLLHDLGNIVKFDFDKYPEFLEDERENIDYWRKVKKATIKKYGSDANNVTVKMLEDLGVDKLIVKIIRDKSFDNSVYIAKCSNWPIKILHYGDLRTLPTGFGSIDDRSREAVERIPKYKDNPNVNKLVEACKKIEIQIQGQVDVDLHKILDKSIMIDPNWLELEI